VKRYATAEGYLEVFANRVVVLVGEATPPEQLDASTQRERLDEAERELADCEEGTAAYERAELKKNRAEAFLRIAESS
jgi:F0F1-type ATP synthase epsilon subunit